MQGAEVSGRIGGDQRPGFDDTSLLRACAADHASQPAAIQAGQEPPVVWAGRSKRVRGRLLPGLPRPRCSQQRLVSAEVCKHILETRGCQRDTVRIALIGRDEEGGMRRRVAPPHRGGSDEGQPQCQGDVASYTFAHLGLHHL